MWERALSTIRAANHSASACPSFLEKNIEHRKRDAFEGITLEDTLYPVHTAVHPQIGIYPPPCLKPSSSSTSSLPEELVRGRAWRNQHEEGRCIPWVKRERPRSVLLDRGCFKVSPAQKRVAHKMPPPPRLVIKSIEFGAERRKTQVRLSPASLQRVSLQTRVSNQGGSAPLKTRYVFM